MDSTKVTQEEADTIAAAVEVLRAATKALDAAEKRALELRLSLNAAQEEARLAKDVWKDAQSKVLRLAHGFSVTP